MSAEIRFRLGEFFGDFDCRRQADGVELALMTAVDHVERHSHRDAHFVLVVEGAYLTDAAPETGPLCGMSVVYNPPGVTHRDRFASPTGRFACLSVAAEKLLPFEGAHQLPDRPTLMRDPSAVADFFHRAFDAESDLDGFSLDALTNVSRSREVLDRTPPFWIRKAIDFIESKLPDAISISGVAGEIGVHPVHLARSFRKFLGESPAQYIQRRRLCRAYEMMATTRHSLADIALACGYADQSHFSRAFRKATRTSADAFRRGRPAFS